MILGFVRQYSTWVLIGLGALAAISVVAFLLTYREARKAPYFFWRQEAAGRARRLLAFFVLLLVLMGGTVWLMLASPVPIPKPTMSPSPSATPTARLAAGSLAPGAIPTVTPTATRQILHIPTASPTPTVTPTAANGIKPAAGGQFTNLVLATGITQNNVPVGEGTQFPVTVERIYAVFRFSNMSAGTPWGYAWYKGAVELVRETEPWPYQTAGRAYIYFTPLGGWTPGEYRVQLFIGERLEQEATFTIQ